jgi:GT2 family glycosyltransferase
MSLKSKQNRNSPPVSVIILTFNGAEYISPLLQSLENQTYPSDLVEIIAVDNASTDDTVGIIQSTHPFVNLVLLENNMGYAAGNNQALLHASHDLLVFLNQDTICHPGFLQSMVGIMETDRTLAACNPNIMPPETAGFGELSANFTPDSLYLCDLALFGYGQNRIITGKSMFRTKLLSGCAFIIRRETILRLGYLFDDQLWMYAEDTDLSLRLHNLSQKICVTRDAIVYHLHNRNMVLQKGRLLMAAGAIRNRVYAFYKNMNGMEFFFFFPFLFFGGILKIFEFPLTIAKKIIYFLPFGLFSMVCMLSAFFDLSRFAAKKRRIMEKRKIPSYALLKFILKRSL